MKKIVMFLLGLVLMIFSGCAGTPVRMETLSKTEKIIKIDNVVQVKRGPTSPFDAGVQFTIENLTGEVLEIDWNSSSLDGDTIITDGQYFHQKNSVKLNTVLAPYSKTTKRINKTSNIDYSFGVWAELGLELPAKLVLRIKYNKTQEDYVIVNLIEKIK